MADILHNTRIKISVEGGVASSVTSDIVDLRSCLGIAHLKLNVDQPFVFSSTTQDKILQFPWGQLLITQGGKLVSSTTKQKPNFKVKA